MSEETWHLTHTRVRYAETDQAGVVYHSNYFIYFEMGRTDLLRALGLPYRQVEEQLGIVLVVVDCRAKYRRPARYDDGLKIATRIRELKLSRITFDYRILRDTDDQLLCEGETVLAAVKNGAATRMPEPILEACRRLGVTRE